MEVSAQRRWKNIEKEIKGRRTQGRKEDREGHEILTINKGTKPGMQISFHAFIFFFRSYPDLENPGIKFHNI